MLWPDPAQRPIALPRVLARLLAGMLPLLCACDSSYVEPTSKLLSVVEDEVIFPRTFVGYPSSQEVRIVNAGRADDHFTVFAMDGPFVVRPEGEVKIRGSSTLTLNVQFNPDRVGNYEETLQLRLGEKSVEIRVAGEAEQPLSCPSTPCSTGKFNPRTGECEIEYSIDGAPCRSDNQCLVGTTCQKGLCVGSERACEPPSACFRSVCNPDFGCEDIPTDDCPQPDNPCRVARCDAVLGCVEEDREDYSPCGPLSCKEQHLCIKGSCVIFDEVPNGSPCTHSCGSGGVCEGGECTRPQGNQLEASWWRKESAEEHLAVENAYLYWLVCERDGCSLASGSPNGFERFRAKLEDLGQVRGLLLLERAALVWGGAGLQAIEGLGVRKWARTVDELLESSDTELPPPEAELLQVIDAGGGRLVARVRREDSNLLLGISAEDGSPAWLAGAPESPIAADGMGRIYSVDRVGEGFELRAYTLEGELSWSSEVPEETRILAALPSRIFLASAGKLDVRLPSSGKQSWERLYEPRDVVLSTSHAFVIEEGPSGPRLIALGVETGNEKGQAYELGAEKGISTLVLRAEDRALLLRYEDGPMPSWRLEEFQAEGERTYTCSLPEVSVAGSWAYLPPADGDQARLVVRTESGEIRTFFAPKLAPPPYGWSASEGSFGRGGRPRL